MNQHISVYIKIVFLFVLLSLPLSFFGQDKRPFVVVLDAGHGGHDPGAKGRFSEEKDINLAVTFLVGDKIKENDPDTKIIYTRDRDIFVPLKRRAEIANEAQADLFISIHTNAATNRLASGTETYTLGIGKNDQHMDVAIRENAVILYEDDYKENYGGFDPNSIESYIIFEFMQDKNMDQSINFASMLQDGFAFEAQRIDRGVRQAGFLVLRNTTMPSVLVELGYISNTVEEKYLNSKSGQKELAESIYSAFKKYKTEFFRKSGTGMLPEKKNERPTVEGGEPALSAGVGVLTGAEKEGPVFPNTVGPQELIFKVKLLTAKDRIPAEDPVFKGLYPIEYYVEDGLYQYTYGKSSDYKEIQQIRESIKSKFGTTIIVSFLNGEKISFSEAMRLIGEF